CVFAVDVKEPQEEEPQVTQVYAECAESGGKVGRWQLTEKTLWYNCTDSASGAGKMICGMGVGNCAPEALQSRTKDGGAGSVVFTINVTSPTPNVLEKWWERHVEKKAATVEGDLAKPPEEVTAGSPKQKAPGDTSFSQDSGTTSAGVEAPPSPPGGAGANSAAGSAATTDPSPSAASQEPDSAPSGEPHDAAHSNSAASAAPESSPDPNS
ncbi:90 kDa surface protein, putative, partial [Trypanosoma cruzi marinkellei]